jgi:hypothetical protein
VKRLIVSLAVGGSLLGGAIAVPLALTAPAAYAAPNNPHSKADPDPNLPLKAQEALIREAAPTDGAGAVLHLTGVAKS